MRRDEDEMRSGAYEDEDKETIKRPIVSTIRRGWEVGVAAVGMKAGPEITKMSCTRIE
jgi:hypothetical protein